MRIISALVGIVVLVAVLICPYTIVLAITAALLSAVAVWELLRNTGKVKNLVQVIGGMLISVAGVMAMYFAKTTVNNSNANTAAAKPWMLFLMALPLIYGLFTAIVWVFNHKKMSVNDACYGFLMTFYPTLGFGCMTLLREFMWLNVWPLLLLLSIAWVSDTGAYFVGTFLGKHKMAPKISPKKSWEGFFGGLICSVAGAVVLRFTGLLDLSLFDAIAVGIIICIFGVLGDLVESQLKRNFGVKDSGSIMPGHGGMLDRFDGALLAFPVAIIYIIFFAA